MVYGSIPYVGMAPKYMAVLELYRNFCPAEKLVQGNQNFRNIGLCGPFFSENFGPRCENNCPTCTTSEFRLLLSYALDRARLLHCGG